MLAKVLRVSNFLVFSPLMQ